MSQPATPRPCHLKESATLKEEPTSPKTATTPTPLTEDNPSPMPQSRQTAVAILLILANIVTMLPFGAGMGGGLHIASTLGVTEPSQASWIAASYPLTAGGFVIMSGRLGSIYGHARVLLLGASWWIVWSLANGFCNDFIAFNVVRAMSGVGGAMVVPNAVAIVGTTFPPGRLRNRCLGLIGAGAPVGGWAGALMAGLLTERIPYKWLFVFIALLGTLMFGSLAIIIPTETPVSENETIDWVGSVLGIAGLISFNFVFKYVPFAINSSSSFLTMAADIFARSQAPKAGWRSPYEITLLIVAIFLFLAFAVWEYHFAKYPIMPLTIFRAPSFGAVIIVVMFSYMSYGTFIWYMIAWQQQIRHWSVLSTAWGLTPLAIFSAAGAFIAAWLVPRLAVQWILAIGAMAVLIAQVLVATMPEQQLYWMQMFPATVIQSFCPDFIYTAAQIVACNNVSKKDQGVAGSLIGTLQLYATSIGLGFAGMVETHAVGAQGPAEGYRAALYFGMGLAGMALAIGLTFVRMPKDTREGWQSQDAGSYARNGEPKGILLA